LSLDERLSCRVRRCGGLQIGLLRLLHLLHQLVDDWHHRRKGLL
jgi:hypothetical protein